MPVWHNDWYRGRFGRVLELVERIEAVEPRHPQVEHDQVRLLLTHGAQARLAVCGLGHPEAEREQCVHGQVARHLVVVDHDRGLSAARLHSRRRGPVGPRRGRRHR